MVVVVVEVAAMLNSDVARCFSNRRILWTDSSFLKHTPLIHRTYTCKQLALGLGEAAAVITVSDEQES